MTGPDEEPDAGRGPVAVPDGFRVGRWVVGERIGAGAWGSVHVGRPAAAGEGPDEVALKFLPSADRSPGERGHLADVVARELRFAAEGGSGLVPVLEVLVAQSDDEALHGAHVLVMERARCSLADVAVDDADEAERTRLLLRTWDALQAVHERDLVHGDVKPANVLLMRGGEVLLADLGLAAELDGTHAYAPRPASVDHVGPEWWEERVGVEGARVRPARDLWAFGVLAHLVLSGRYPFDGQTPRARAFAARAYAGDGAPLRLAESVPPAWRPVLADLLRADPAEREASRPAVQERLEAIERGGALAAQASATGRWTRGRVGALVAVALLLGIGTPAAVLAVGGGADPTDGLGPGDIRPDAAVPARYRGPIEAAASACGEPAVTPALIAAILEVESGFDEDLDQPERDEVGIARWTPSVFEEWDADADGGDATPRSAPDSIRTLGVFLCQIESRFPNARGDSGLLRAAAFRGGSKRVIAADGVPPVVARYVGAVRRERASFAVDGVGAQK